MRFDPVKHASRLESPRRLLRQPPELVLPYLPAVGGPLVEVGCGTGYFGRILARYRPDNPYLGLDPSEVMLSRFAGSLDARDRKRVTLVRHNRESIPLAEASVGLLFLANVIHELKTDRGILAEIRRVVAPGGWVFLVDWRKRPTAAGPPVFLKTSSSGARRVFRELGFLETPLPCVYPRHYCLLFRKEN
jgi:SAM-dependent methyltransferase